MEMIKTSIIFALFILVSCVCAVEHVPNVGIYGNDATGR